MANNRQSDVANLGSMFHGCCLSEGCGTGEMEDIQATLILSR
jgi:hypothetical protein